VLVESMRGQRQKVRLLTKELPLQFYSRECLFGDEARVSWVEPDRHPLNW